MKESKTKNIIFYVVVVTVLTLNYYNNFWGLVKTKMFDEFDIYCHSQVIGRINLAEKEGVWAKGGFNGWVRDSSDMSWDEMLTYQYKYYQENLNTPISNFVIYDGQIGGQAITFAALDKISPFSNAVNLQLFWLIVSLSTALVMTFFVIWTKRNYGFTVSIITFIFILLSLWVTLFGRNLYMIISSFYLPFIVFLFMFDKESRTAKTNSWIKLFLISASLILVKLFFSGFEYIPTALVMMTVPLFHYLFLNKWKIKFFIMRLISVSAGAITAIIVYIVAYAYQLSTIKGSMAKGFEHIIWSYLKRSNGNSADFPEAFKDSLDSNVFYVIGIYFCKMIFDATFFKMNFLILFFFISLFTYFVFKSHKISPTVHKNREKLKVLVYTTWVSILAPLSWYVFFKAHAYIHVGYDALVWYMPFCLFAFIFMGSMLYYFYQDFVVYIKSRRTNRSI
jgi:hypothetical protein